MDNDGLVAEILVLTAVFMILITLLGTCFLIKLGKIDQKEDKITRNEEGGKKRLWQVFWDLFTEKCEICQKSTSIYLADRGKGGDSFFVCEECGKDFENLREITRSSWIYPTI